MIDMILLLHYIDCWWHMCYTVDKDFIHCIYTFYRHHLLSLQRLWIHIYLSVHRITEVMFDFWNLRKWYASVQAPLYLGIWIQTWTFKCLCYNFSSCHMAVHSTVWYFNKIVNSAEIIYMDLAGRDKSGFVMHSISCV